MKDLFFRDENEFNSYINNYENIGKGCFLVDNKYVVKRISDEYIKEYSYMIDSDVLLRFKDIEIEHIFFPKSLVYIDGKICGYVTEYIKGKNGQGNYFKEIKIDKLLDSIDNFMNTIRQISDLGIRIVDPYIKNIIFDGDNFNFIDMSECEYVFDDKELLYQDNLINTMYEIFINIFESNESICDDNSISLYLNNNGFMNNNIYIDESLLNPCDTIRKVRLFLENKIGKKINYFIEVDRYLLENNLRYDIIGDEMSKNRLY